MYSLKYIKESTFVKPAVAVIAPLKQNSQLLVYYTYRESIYVSSKIIDNFSIVKLSPRNFSTDNTLPF